MCYMNSKGGLNIKHNTTKCTITEIEQYNCAVCHQQATKQIEFQQKNIIHEKKLYFCENCYNHLQKELK